MCLSLKFSADPSLPIVKVTDSKLNGLPDELLLMILNGLDSYDLLALRSVNKHLARISHEILRARIRCRVKILNAQLSDIEKTYQAMHDEKMPQLDHFKGFLMQLPATHIQEASWYTIAPKELATICECLVILKQGPLKSTSPVEKWVEIRRIMSKYEFKNWYTNLKENVEHLSMSHVQLVQNIIMHDPTITYERAHEVSICGYQLLIAIAASLQFATINQDLHATSCLLMALERRIKRSGEFLSIL